MGQAKRKKDLGHEPNLLPRISYKGRILGMSATKRFFHRNPKILKELTK